MITNIDAMYIIVFQIIISAIVMKFKPLNAMISGILIASIGMGLMFFSMNPVFLLFAILIFSLGEMSSSPKITEYIGRIAPKDRVAMYMGTSFLPVALGSSIAGYLSGSVYQNIADKISIIYKDGLARGINLQKINNNFTQTDLINEYLQKTNQTLNQMNNYLWSEYQPYNILYVYASIGFITTLGLLAYHKFANK
jgi:dipeptide/tripeptide permease